MKDIITYINENAILASLISLAISTVVQIAFRYSDRRYSEKVDNKKEKRKQFENKAEFIIEKTIEDDGTIPRINLIMSDFKVKVTEDKSDVDFYYSKDILNNKKYKHMLFYIKNIGNADVNQLDICVTSQKNTMISSVEYMGIYVKNKTVNYSHCYDRRIRKGDVVLIDIAYLENGKIFSTLSSELLLLYRDSYNNLYEQPFFLEEANLYEPSRINYKDYRLMVTDDVAIECFKDPLKW